MNIKRSSGTLVSFQGMASNLHAKSVTHVPGQICNLSARSIPPVTPSPGGEGWGEGVVSRRKIVLVELNSLVKRKDGDQTVHRERPKARNRERDAEVEVPAFLQERLLQRSQEIPGGLKTPVILSGSEGSAFGQALLVREICSRTPARGYLIRAKGMPSSGACIPPVATTQTTAC